MSTVVIRFSSLGDIVLAGSVTGPLGPVVFLTLERYADIARELPGVIEVRTWEASGRQALDGATRIIDLHASPRSRVATAFRGVPIHRVQRHDLKRRMRVAFKSRPPTRVIDRYATAAQVAISPHPWLPQADGDGMVLIPGAQHKTKQWQPDAWSELGRRWDGPVSILGSETESHMVHRIADDIGTQATPIAERGFEKTLVAIRTAKVAVGGDTGLLHLAAASGVPVVALFGPTHPDDGHWCHPGTVIQHDLSCRPCSRHGSQHCPMGDHACMQSIDVDAVWTEVEHL
jgi:heptosyltransferase II